LHNRPDGSGAPDNSPDERAVPQTIRKEVAEWNSNLSEGNDTLSDPLIPDKSLKLATQNIIRPNPRGNHGLDMLVRLIPIVVPSNCGIERFMNSFQSTVFHI
jgi:hypothetical protein